MTQREFLEYLEPGGPPYGVLHGSSFKFEDIMQNVLDLLRQNPDLKALMETGDIVQGLQEPSRP